MTDSDIFLLGTLTGLALYALCLKWINKLKEIMTYYKKEIKKNDVEMF